MASTEGFTKAIVKNVLSGDSFTLQSTITEEGKDVPHEKQFSLAYVSAPRLKREGDEPYAFQSREYVRKNVLNHSVRFKTLYTIPASQREYGLVVLNDGSNLAEKLLNEGLVKVREEAGRKDDTEEIAEIIGRYKVFEEAAKEAKIGLFGGDSGAIRCENDYPADAAAFLEKWKGKRLEAIVERVIAGDRIVVRLILTPNLHQSTAILLAGVRCPNSARPDQPAEEFGNEAKTFTESRLSQQRITVELVGSNQQNLLIGKVWVGKASVAELLLQEGLARVNDQHIVAVGSDISKLRNTEGQAKNKKLRLWKNFVPKKTEGGIEAIVTRIWSADTFTVRNKAGAEKKVSLSSIRAPKVIPNKETEPYANEAKEYLRKKLIGKTVSVRIDGKKPANDGFPEKEVATIVREGKNVALALVEAGYASVVRHRRDDEDRSPDYDDLLQAEEEAKAAKKGIHSDKKEKLTELVDIDSVIKAKTQFSFLQRLKRVPAVVDYVVSGGRFKLIIPKENIRITFLLAGLTVPRTARPGSEKPDGEPWGTEAAEFSTRRLMQRDVEVEFESTDKVGGFIGTLFIGRENFSKLILEEGLASVHAYSAEKSPYGNELFGAEERAKAARKNMWKNYVEQAEVVEEASTEAAPVSQTRRNDYRNIEVLDVAQDGRLKIQIKSPEYTGKLDKLQTALRQYLRDNGASSALKDVPKRNDIVAARFSEDNQFYRAKVTSIDKASQKAQVMYIDYGNVETLPITSLLRLPEDFSVSKLRPQGIDAVLSFIQLPQNEDYLADAIHELENRLIGVQKMIANVDFEDEKEKVLYVSLYADTDKKIEESVNASLVEDGFVLVARKFRAWELGKGYKAILADMKKKEEEAKEQKFGIWEYGDVHDD